MTVFKAHEEKKGCTQGKRKEVSPYSLGTLMGLLAWHCLFASHLSVPIG
jgi:hypothetical protein